MTTEREKLVNAVLEHLPVVLAFVIEDFPSYEGSLSWGDSMELDDAYFGRAALALKNALESHDKEASAKENA